MCPRRAGLPLPHPRHPALHGVDDWQTPGRALVTMFGLLERADDLPSRFSRGMRQKTALAVALTGTVR